MVSSVVAALWHRRAEARSRAGRRRAGVRSTGRGQFSRAGSFSAPDGRAAMTTPADEDDRIITELYRQYRAPLLSYVLRLTAGDRQHAEDVVQETMVRAWRQAARLDLAGPSLMPWLATVARRIVIDQGRRRRARPAETGDTMLEHVPAADPADQLLQKVIVADALRALSAAHREVLSETILRDRTVNEAAEVLGIPVGTVKSRVYYALRALRLVLAERGVSP
jgi:RNA polymerase sigma-70 factor (ECF subfamily)